MGPSACPQQTPESLHYKQQIPSSDQVSINCALAQGELASRADVLCHLVLPLVAQKLENKVKVTAAEFAPGSPHFSSSILVLPSPVSSLPVEQACGHLVLAADPVVRTLSWSVGVGWGWGC